MSNSIYEQALIDAESLKNAAEERVKQKLVESMSPKIKTLIESQLFENSVEEDHQEECGTGTYSESDISELEELDELDELDEEELKDNDMMESVNVLKILMSENYKKNMVEKKLLSIKENLVKVKSAKILSENNNSSDTQKQRIDTIISNLKEELNSLKESSIINSNENLLELYINMNKELNNMSRRRSNFNRKLEDLLESNLFEEDQDEEVESEENQAEAEEFDLGDFEESLGEDVDLDDEVDLEKAEDAVVDLIDALNLNLMQEDEDEDEEEEDKSEEEEGDEELEEAHHIEMDEKEGCYEMDEMEEGPGCYGEEDSNEGVLEIDENMLRREIGKMKRLREGDAASGVGVNSFGGGDLGPEMFVDVDDGILNVNADELGDAPRPSLKKESAEYKQTVRENRVLRKQLQESKSALKGMKTQLEEMNLFNAKLLYANKLMQNRDLSLKQQKHIVESLDDASTLNEAKLLFESLSKTLNKSRRGRNLNESASRRILGSSSKSVKSSQSAQSGKADLNRWAKLAGLK